MRASMQRYILLRQSSVCWTGGYQAVYALSVLSLCVHSHTAEGEGPCRRVASNNYPAGLRCANRICLTRATLRRHHRQQADSLESGPFRSLRSASAHATDPCVCRGSRCAGHQAKRAHVVVARRLHDQLRWRSGQRLGRAGARQPLQLGWVVQVLRLRLVADYLLLRELRSELTGATNSMRHRPSAFNMTEHAGYTSVACHAATSAQLSQVLVVHMPNRPPVSSAAAPSLSTAWSRRATRGQPVHGWLTVDLEDIDGSQH